MKRFRPFYWCHTRHRVLSKPIAWSLGHQAVVNHWMGNGLTGLKGAHEAAGSDHKVQNAPGNKVATSGK